MASFEIEKEEPKENIRKITWGNLTWVDIVPPTKESMKYLEDNYHFHALALEDCLSRRQISKMDVFPGYLFFVFHFPSLNCFIVDVPLCLLSIISSQ